jgi:glycosyltransferase involved in cell wall biosynthesis
MELTFGIIAPAYNEGGGLMDWHKSLRESVGARIPLIIVNDGSSDDTINYLIQMKNNDSNLYIIDFEKNFGQQLAILAGLEFALQRFPNLDFFVTLDSDGQDPVDLILQMVIKLNYSKVDILVGAREDRSVDSLTKRITAKVYYKIMNKILDIKLIPEAAEFRVIRKNALVGLLEFKDKRPFWRGLVHYYTPRVEVFMYSRAKRIHGQSNYNIKQMFRLAESGLVNFSEKPLRFLFWLGLLISFASVALGLFFLVGFLIGSKVISGWLSLSLMALFFGGIQILAIGIIGIYILELVRNSRNRPRYVIRKIYD